MVNIMGIIGSAVAVLAVTFVANRFVFKSEFDAQTALLNAVTVAIVLGVAGIVTKKVGVKGDGLAELPSKIKAKG